MQQSETTKKCYRIKVRLTKTGTTHFDDYDFEYNPWKIWEHHLQSAIKSDLKNLKSEKYRQRVGYFHDEKFYHYNIHNQMYGALIVAIYAEVETCLNKIFDFETYDYKCFNCKLKQYKIEKKNIAFYKEINTLRLLTNAYKHNDMKITKELSKILKTNEGTIIDYTHINIRDLVNQCCKFLWSIEKSLKEIMDTTN